MDSLKDDVVEVWVDKSIVLMKKNMGVLDRTIRTIIAIIGGFMVYLNMVEGASASVLLVVVGIFVLTSLVGFCPLYGVFRLNTSNL